VTTLAIRIFMNTYGRYEIVEDECYRDFLEVVLQQQDVNNTFIGNMFGGGGGGGRSDGTKKNIRQPNQGLITISNHRSLFDDPGIVSCLLPLPQAIQPKYNRWGICSQEYCFNDALPGIIKGYIGAGQVLPICRGGGIDQKLLLDFGRHLACGEWCHLFPEGGVWQWEELGGRRELPRGAVSRASSDFGSARKRRRRDGSSSSGKGENDDDDAMVIIPATTKQKALPPSSKGKLKWGVGKLIAHAPITPKVIPFAHVGMEKLLPQDDITGKTKLRHNLLQSMLTSIFFGGDDDATSLRVKVQFGSEITFDDLLSQHEATYGKLWKYSGKVDAEEERERGQSHGAFHKYWNSSLEERVLYGKIVRRIEERLEVVTREVCGGVHSGAREGAEGFRR
jgi:monolysocardiolipin acyltransferase